MTFLLLTSKPGQFRTELGEHLKEIEAYDYVAQGRIRAHFIIAEVIREAKIRVIDDGVPPVVNTVPSKFFPRFDTIEKARHELGQLTQSSSGESRLTRL